MKLITLGLIWLVSFIALKAGAKCTKVWVDDDAVFESRSMAATHKYERKSKRLTWKRDHEEEKSRVLTDDKLEKVLASLCLKTIKNEPAPPPGGPADIKITGKTGERRLGWKGNTGGTYFVLTPAELKNLFDAIDAETKN